VGDCKKTSEKTMSQDPLKPTSRLLAKLGSLVEHVEELKKNINHEQVLHISRCAHTQNCSAMVWEELLLGDGAQPIS
jgi:hypothetical protein